MVQNAPGWTLPPAISQYPKVSVARGEAPWLVQLSRTVVQGWRSRLLWQEHACPHGQGVPSSLGHLCTPQVSWQHPRLGGPTCMQLLRGDISLLSHLGGGCPRVLLAIWHVPQPQEALPQRAVSRSVMALQWEPRGGCCPPVTPQTFSSSCFSASGKLSTSKPK